MYTPEEIRVIHTRARSTIGQIYESTDGKTYEGIALGKLKEITQPLIIQDNSTNIQNNTTEINENELNIQTNSDRIDELEVRKADKCFAIAMGLIL